MRTKALVLWTIGLVLFMAVLGLCARPVSAETPLLTPTPTLVPYGASELGYAAQNACLEWETPCLYGVGGELPTPELPAVGGPNLHWVAKVGAIVGMLLIVGGAALVRKRE